MWAGPVASSANHHLVLVCLYLSPLVALNRKVESTGDLSHLLCSAIDRETEAESGAHPPTDTVRFGCNWEVPSLLEVPTQ